MIGLWAQGGIAIAQGGPPQAAAVRVDAVAMTALDATTPVLGRVVTRQGGVIAARVAGPVQSVTANVGDQVAANDLLAVLDRDRLQLEVDLAAAELATADADLATARARRTQAGLEFDRLDRLQGSAAFSQARYEDAETEVIRTRSEIVAAEARQQRAKAALDLAQLDLTRAEVRAPYDGVVTMRHAEPGAYLAVGESVITLMDLSELEIEADVPFDRLAGLRPGTLVTVEFDNGHQQALPVRTVVPEENPRTRTRAVRLSVKDAELAAGLAINAATTVMVPLDAEAQALTVHKDAVIKRLDGSIVFVAEPTADGGDAATASQRKVRLGRAVGERFEVLDGLVAGELAVTRGNERLRPGQALQLPPVSTAEQG
ncbi:MAG: efflux RND transporter periplasmic adaptor subunit [Alphaproteobacteria bacterium]|nr:efflux RND transporter periplasmic adaptor subunit [Alphaproteobacteria bacterium SS10]